MATSFHTAQRRGFVKGGGSTYTCRCCKRVTRPTGTGDNDGVRLCVQCYDLAGEENHLSDNGELYSSPKQVLFCIEELDKMGADTSCWADLKKTAQDKLAA